MGPWECVRCGRVNAAWMPWCDCKPGPGTGNTVPVVQDCPVVVNGRRGPCVYGDSTSGGLICVQCGQHRLPPAKLRYWPTKGEG